MRKIHRQPTTVTSRQPYYNTGEDAEAACRQAMEPHNLDAASTYINNVLLARGLLQGGTPIDFAQPENDEGGVDGTMARVINLVNDLVLRRDVCDDDIAHAFLVLRSQGLTVYSAKPIIGRTSLRRFELSGQTNRSIHWKLYAKQTKRWLLRHGQGSIAKTYHRANFEQRHPIWADRWRLQRPRSAHYERISPAQKLPSEA